MHYNYYSSIIEFMTISNTALEAENNSNERDKFRDFLSKLVLVHKRISGDYKLKTFAQRR